MSDFPAEFGTHPGSLNQRVNDVTGYDGQTIFFRDVVCTRSARRNGLLRRPRRIGPGIGSSTSIESPTAMTQDPYRLVPVLYTAAKLCHKAVEFGSTTLAG